MPLDSAKERHPFGPYLAQMLQRVSVEIAPVHSRQPAQPVHASAQIRRTCIARNEKNPIVGRYASTCESRRQRRKRSVRNPDSVSSVVIIDPPVGTMLDRRVMRRRNPRRMHHPVAGADKPIAKIDALVPEKKLRRIPADRQHLLAAERDAPSRIKWVSNSRERRARSAADDTSRAPAPCRRLR